VDLIVDETHLGTPETAWKGSGRLDSMRPLDIRQPRRVIVVAPHPDDEVLGIGGLLQHFVATGVPIEILAVTDGEGSHPSASAARTGELGHLRRQETVVALRRLGCSTATVTRLGLPDGGVTAGEDRLRHALAVRAHEDDLWLAPWSNDGHPDHDACGRATCTTAAQCGVRSLGYLIWAWHWADPSGVDLPWEQCRRFDLDGHSLDRKRWGIEAFASQIRPLGSASGDAPVLPASVLERFHRSFEVYVEEGPGS
jgi:LmbE family N-acetylglucosaminyl deacetylase